jgi:glycosyltransferase involved in cell wall biosynthesis
MIKDHSGQFRSNGSGQRKASKPMKVLHVINDLSIGGTEIMLFKLLSGTDRKRFQPTVISLNGMSPLADQINDLGIPVESLGAKSGIAGSLSFLRLVRAIRRLSPDLIQGWMYHGNLAAQIGAMFSRRPVKVVWNIRQSLSSLADEKPATARAIKLGARISNWPDLILNNSQKSVQQHAALGFPADKTLVIPNGFDTDTFVPSDDARASVRAELGIPRNAVLVGRIGRYHHTKDYPNFLQAAAFILRDYPDTQFMVAGNDVDWNNHALRGRIHQLGLVERIHLLGERFDIPRLTAALDIAVSSSHAEGFPNVIGEAMACAVPCVVTDVGHSGWLVGDTGRIVPPQDSEALADNCRELIHLGRESRNRLGNAARVRIIERYSIASVVRFYESLYQHIVAEGTLKNFLLDGVDLLNEPTSTTSPVSELRPTSRSVAVNQFASGALNARPDAG